MDWGRYEKRQFWVWIRQWAFGEARWKKPANVSNRGRSLSVADSSSSGDSARRYTAGIVAVGADDPNAGHDSPSEEPIEPEDSGEMIEDEAEQ